MPTSTTCPAVRDSVSPCFHPDDEPGDVNARVHPGDVNSCFHPGEADLSLTETDLRELAALATGRR